VDHGRTVASPETANGGKQPQLDDNQLLRLVRSFEVAGERRSTTRYLAEVTYHFNPAAVRHAASEPHRVHGDAFQTGV
jgi:hypothetical protein